MLKNIHLKLTLTNLFVIGICIFQPMHCMENTTKSNSTKEEEANEKLINAILKNNPEEVEKALTEGANVDFKDEGELNPLLFCCFLANRFNLVEILIKHNANINFKNKYGSTALEYAALNDFVDIVKFLIKSSKNIIDASDAFRTSIIHKSLKTIPVFIDNFNEKIHIDVNTKDEHSGMTLLMHAAKKGIFEAVQFLTKNGADVNAEDIYGNMAAEYAYKNDHKAIALYLVCKPRKAI